MSIYVVMSLERFSIELLWFCITKTNRDLPVYVSPRFVSTTCNFDWLTGLSPSFVIGQSNLLCFWFYDIQMKLALCR